VQISRIWNYEGLSKAFDPNSERSDMKMKENAVARNRNDVALENNFMFTTA